jgi:toxin-antitoxin system PIN domain toxin
VILIDANLLIYAYNASADVHEKARTWLEDALSGGDPVGLAWSSIHAFLRLTTHHALFPEPLSIVEAITIVKSWLAQPIVTIVEPGMTYWTILESLLRQANVRGPLVMDAHLAALAIENGAVLHTTDRDFRRFEGVQIRNPLLDTDAG